MKVITAICPICGNEPEGDICEDCGYDGNKYGWYINILFTDLEKIVDAKSD